MPDYDDAYLGVENKRHPANEKEIEIPQVTIDEYWYLELKKDRKKLKSIKPVIKELIDYAQQVENVYLLEKLKLLKL